MLDRVYRLKTEDYCLHSKYLLEMVSGRPPELILYWYWNSISHYARYIDGSDADGIIRGIIFKATPNGVYSLYG